MTKCLNSKDKLPNAQNLGKPMSYQGWYSSILGFLEATGTGIACCLTHVAITLPSRLPLAGTDLVHCAGSAVTVGERFFT
jgi:hypothetical protein